MMKTKKYNCFSVLKEIQGKTETTFFNIFSFRVATCYLTHFKGKVQHWYKPDYQIDKLFSKNLLHGVKLSMYLNHPEKWFSLKLQITAPQTSLFMGEGYTIINVALNTVHVSITIIYCYFVELPVLYLFKNPSVIARVKINQNVDILAKVYLVHLKVKRCQTLRVVSTFTGQNESTVFDW